MARQHVVGNDAGVGRYLSRRVDSRAVAIDVADGSATLDRHTDHAHPHHRCADRTASDASHGTPVPLRSTATFGGRVTGVVTSIKPAQVKTVVPGEIAGPALAVTITLRNDSSRRIALGNTVVTLAYGPARTPAGTFVRLAEQAAPDVGSTRSQSRPGTFTFGVPKANQNDVLYVYLSYSPTAPAVIFSGRR